MSSKNPEKKRKTAKLSKGLSIDRKLHSAIMAVAKKESRSFSFIVRRAIERDLHGHLVTADSPQYVGQTDELIDIHEVCRRLKISIWTARRRSRRRGDPLRLAKSRIGKQKPMHFSRSQIEQLSRGLAA